MRRRALLLGLGSVAACGPKPRPSPPPAPAVTSAGELIPADLDVVARLDWGRMKGALGSIALSALSNEVLAQSGAGREADELVIASLLAADQVYLGYRPSPLLMPLDRVLAVQGRFEQLTRPPTGFSGATDLGGDFRYWDRQAGATVERGSVVRIYALGDRVRAFVSEAEIDAVERLLAGQGAERRLEPPVEGTLSLAARPWLLGQLVGRGSILLRPLIDQAKELRAVADLESDGIAVKLELILASAEEAQRLTDAVRQVLERWGGQLGSGSELRADGARVLLSARLNRLQLAPAIACLRGGSESGCPW